MTVSALGQPARHPTQAGLVAAPIQHRLSPTPSGTRGARAWDRPLNQCVRYPFITAAEQLARASRLTSPPETIDGLEPGRLGLRARAINRMGPAVQLQKKSFESADEVRPMADKGRVEIVENRRGRCRQSYIRAWLAVV